MLFRSADHHPYTTADLAELRRHASVLDAGLVTTAKDLMRIPVEQRSDFAVVRIGLAWSDEAAIKALLDRALLE